jgi:HTH-type transcriptional regulator, transcriptional repressor of NAD biosynthesis genes
MTGGSRYAHGLVIGKFYPPHAGHHRLIDAAAERCERVTVVVAGHDVETIPYEARASWVAATHAHQENVRVVAERDPHPVDFDSDSIWAAHVEVFAAAVTRGVLADGLAPESARIDAVFSSEAYGDELARRFRAEHVAVDPARDEVPMSGTAARADVVAAWDRLAPRTRAGLAVRVVVLGAESTGTTTLATGLTSALRERGGPWTATECVPEYGRTRTLEKLAALDAQRLLDRPATVWDLCWTDGDLLDVAVRQNADEDVAAAAGGPVVVCDTDAFATGVWYERYLDGRSPAVEALARRHPLYLLTDHRDVPFDQDGIRDGQHLRTWMHDRFAERLTETGREWRLVGGAPDERVEQALAAVDDTCRRAWTYSAPLA